MINTIQPIKAMIRCPHCQKMNHRHNFLCRSCGNLLDIPPQESKTGLLNDTDALGYSDDYFDANSILVLRVHGTEKIFQLQASQLAYGRVIGRNVSGTARTAHIDLAGCEPGISRRHAQICYDPRNKVVRIKDLNSVNGTFINGQRLHPEEIRVLRHGDKIRTGKLELGVTILQPCGSVDLF